jgi:ABC-type transport system involved in multi-copper enzyme maturation permease subunit
MNAHRLAVIFAWLVRDTFRQSLASGLFWLLLAISGLSIVVCSSVSISGPLSLVPADGMPDFLPKSDLEAKDPEKLQKSGVTAIDGELRLGFGAIRVPLARDARSAVHFLELILAGGVADTLGLLLTLVWTAGFLPGFLDGRSVSVLLAKPAPRWCLLAGKYVGVLAFVLLHATIFVGGTWLAIGLRTGIWDASYLWSIPLLLLHFSIFFSFSLLLAVCTRSTVVCVFGSIAFWGLCWGINYGRHAVAAAAKIAPEGEFSSSVVWLADIGYWLLPKPADMSMLLFDALDARSYFSPLFETGGLFAIELSVLTSLAFTAYVLVAAARQFAVTDY